MHIFPVLFLSVYGCNIYDCYCTYHVLTYIEQCKLAKVNVSFETIVWYDWLETET